MKRNVNGQEIELKSGTATVERVQDRLMVRNGSGVHTALAVRDGKRTLVSYRGNQYVVEPIGAAKRAGSTVEGSGEVRAPMPGQIADVRVTVGQEVSRGQTLVVLEAMKTQQPLVAPFDGTVTSVKVNTRDQVNDGVILVEVQPINKS